MPFALCGFTGQRQKETGDEEAEMDQLFIQKFWLRHCHTKSKRDRVFTRSLVLIAELSFEVTVV
jgi:hypothetical protein